MPSFSKTSKQRLYTCREAIIILCEDLIKEIDFSVLCGQRNEADQNEAYRTGRSTKQFPGSKHNLDPSPAVDLAPFPVNWQQTDRFAYFAGHVMQKAKQMGIWIKWGGDWDGDFDIQEHRLIDMPHFELIT